MGREAEAGGSVSPLVSRPALIVWCAGIIASLLLHLPLMAGLFLTFLLLGLMVRFWGGQAMRGVTLQVSCSRPHLYPGQTVTLSYRLENNKFLPLLWLELTQNGAEKDCLTPEPAMETYREPGSPQDAPASLRQTFACVGSFRSLQTERTWRANRRGLYIIRQLEARSGDGFGLVTCSRTLPAGEIPVLAVYPRPVKVTVAPLLRLMWNHASGSRGWIEDPTILRGSREYQPGDNWKAINWRMAARDQGLPINLYQTVRPQRIRFVLDGESFLAGGGEALEEALEILAAVLSALSERRLELSLSLPHSRRFPAVTLTGGPEGDIRELLLYLAGYDCAALPADADDTGSPRENGAWLPSAFPEDVFLTSGAVWILTFSGSRLPAALLPRLNVSETWFLCREDWDACRAAGFKALPLTSLRA